ncbi:MAG: GNAT family N-acetyltransferase [Jejuia sp.]
MAILEFSKDYILEDKRVRLSPLKFEHFKDLVKITNDSDLWKYFLEKGDGEENLKKYITETVGNRKQAKEYPFVIFDKLKNRFAGTTRFYDYSADLKIIKIGHTWIGKEFQGTGLNKHCKYVLFQFAFETLNLERIGFGAHSENTRSIKAMESVGCKKEGVLRSFLPAINTKGRADIVLLSILKDEWLESTNFKLQQKLTN